MKLAHRIGITLFIGFGLAAMCLIVYPSLKQAWYDFDTLYSRKQIQSWLSAPQQAIDPAQLAQAQQSLAAASVANPGVAQFHIERAKLAILRSFAAQNTIEQRNQFYALAILHYRNALNAQPNNTHSMANIVQFKAYLGQADDEFERLFKQTQIRAPHEPDLQLTLLNAGYQNWARLSPAMQAEVRQLQSKALATQEGNVRKLQNNYPNLKI